MTISLQPKQDFIRDKAAASAHQDVMASPQFHSAAKAALLEYQRSFMYADAVQGAIVSLKVKGAHEFLAVLMNLGEPDKPRIDRPSEQLNPV